MNAMRKDEITPCEKTEPATRKDEISARKDEKTPCEKTPFETLILSFRVASLFFFAWRLVVFSPGVIFIFSSFRMASFCREKTPCEKRKIHHAKTRKDEIKKRRKDDRKRRITVMTKYLDSCFSVDCAGTDLIAICKEAV